MLANASWNLVLAGFAALALSTTACSELKSTFPCGPGAYRNGPVGHDNQPMVANPCHVPQFAGWGGLPAAPPPAVAQVPTNETPCPSLTEGQATEGSASGYVVYPSHIGYYGDCGRNR